MNTSTIGKKLIGILLFAAAGAIANAAVSPRADVGLTRPMFAAVQPRAVEIRAKKFEFTPSAITLKKGGPLILRLTSEDRTHGFLLKPLNIDTESSPARPRPKTTLWSGCYSLVKAIP